MLYDNALMQIYCESILGRLAAHVTLVCFFLPRLLTVSFAGPNKLIGQSFLSALYLQALLFTLNMTFFITIV